MKRMALVLLAAAFAAAPTFCTAADDPPVRARDSGDAMSGLYLKVRLSNHVRMSKLKAGDLVGGHAGKGCLFRGPQALPFRKHGPPDRRPHGQTKAHSQ